jgi:hypothetical protein
MLPKLANTKLQKISVNHVINNYDAKLSLMQQLTLHSFFFQQ